MRSWTLQELLAPAEMIFFNSAWDRIGSKSELSHDIGLTTFIPASALRWFDSSKYSIARRMSWAARREATRIEDVAYSLLEIFDINIPLLYGEGSRAFQRLQEAIMSVSNDMSLFVWNGESCPKFGLLAASPSGFSESQYAWENRRELSRGYSFNNAGLFVELETRPLFLSADLEGVYAAYLHDPSGYSGGDLKIEIYLLKESQRNLYRRVSIKGRNWDVASNWSHSDGNAPPVRVCQTLIQRAAVSECLEPQVKEVIIDSCPQGVYSYTKSGPRDWSGLNYWKLDGEGTGKDLHIAIPSHTACGVLGYLAWRAAGDDLFIVYFGYDFDFHPFCLAFCHPETSKRNPRRGHDIPPKVLMAWYYQLLPASSSLNCAKKSGSSRCAARGEQTRGSKRRLLGLNLTVQFYPVMKSLFRMVIDFGSAKVLSTRPSIKTDKRMEELENLSSKLLTL